MQPIMTPQESLDVIKKIIDVRRIQYENNGRIIFMWGAVVMAAGIIQFVLTESPLSRYSWTIWLFTMVPMFIYSFIEGGRNARKNRRKIHSGDNIIKLAWLMTGIMAMLNGFIFPDRFGIGFTTVMYLPFCVAALVTALSLQRLLFVGYVVLSTFVAYTALFIPFYYHSLVAALIGFFLFFLPGLTLMRDYRKRTYV